MWGGRTSEVLGSNGVGIGVDQLHTMPALLSMMSVFNTESSRMTSRSSWNKPYTKTSFLGVKIATVWFAMLLALAWAS